MGSVGGFAGNGKNTSGMIIYNGRLSRLWQSKVKDFLFSCLISGASNGILSRTSGIVDFAPFNMRVVCLLFWIPTCMTTFVLFMTQKVDVHFGPLFKESLSVICGVHNITRSMSCV